MKPETASSPARMDLSIIIVNWNSKDYLQNCIASILTGTHGLTYEIIVIDAGSFDGSDTMLREHFPQVRFIQSEKNPGFAGANNTAFRVAQGRVILFLNPDTEVIGSAINTMYDQLQTLPLAGVVGCKLLNGDRTVQTTCVQCVPTILNQVLDSRFLQARWPNSGLWGMAPLYAAGGEPKIAEAISGACMMLKREMFERVGMFSEDYFMYVEDIDLCYKLKRAGCRNYFVPSATVIHFGGGSSQTAASNFSFIMLRESIWRFLRKNRGRIYGVGYRASMLCSAAVRLLFLTALFPLRRRSKDASFRKWRAILGWSLNREQWIKPYS